MKRSLKNSEEFDRSSQDRLDESDFSEVSNNIRTPGASHKSHNEHQISTENFMRTNTYKCIVTGRSTLEHLTKVNRGLMNELMEREEATKNLMQYVNRLMDQDKKLNERISQMKVQNESDLEKLE